MGNCWYCHWGWPAKVGAIHKRAAEMLGNARFDAEHPGVLAAFGLTPSTAGAYGGSDDTLLNYGPGHSVWEDENLDDDSVWWCLHKAIKREYGDDEWSDREWAIIAGALWALLQIPEEERDPEPDEYDGEDPRLWPPPPGLAMVRSG